MAKFEICGGVSQNYDHVAAAKKNRDSNIHMYFGS